MLIYQHMQQRVVPAAAKAVFDVVGDLAQHPRLAGSGEVKTVRLLGDRVVGVGSRFEADEEIRIARRWQRFTAVSTVVEYDPPHVISWTSVAPDAPRGSRVQWWYEMTPHDEGTLVTERVEVDLGLGALSVLARLPYRALRGSAIRAGMARTLQNLEALTASADA
ncbi:MAG: hypothetical protein GC157_10095 [Frankiales bacterium]|nr:hypothetical protein [Frankiales bacterium]